MTTQLTRVTIIGSTRKATLVLPDDPIGTLLPDIASLLNEPAGNLAHPLTLITTLGEELERAATAADQNITDGATLRLIRVVDAPAPPEVTDVTDIVADTLDALPSRWSSASRELLGSLATGIVAGGAALLAAPDAWLIVTLFCLAVVSAILVGRFGARWIATLSTAAAVGLSFPLGLILNTFLLSLFTSDTAGSVTAVTLVDASTLVPNLFGVAFTSLGFLWIALGAGIGLGRRHPAALTGSVTGILLSSVAVICVYAGLSNEQTAAITAVLCVAALGLAPVIAMHSARLTTLDDQVIAGDLPPLRSVRTSVDVAYRTLTWAIFAVAAPATIAAATLVARADLWPTLTGVALIVVLALRTRVTPLTNQVWALWGSIVLGGMLGVISRPGLPSDLLGIAAIVTVILIAVLVGARPADHTRAKLRRWGDLVEGLAVLVLVPGVFGIFGVFEMLLGAFS